ncbi:MAG: hypothetical protein KDD11_14340 [Acidobacteria bacterium]|nr:hypothetical protein [Acidobacteriota bacterium]
MASLLATSATAQSTSYLPLGFKNLEGQAASGLVVELDAPSSCNLRVERSNRLTESSWEGRTLRLTGGQVDRRDSVRILLAFSCFRTPEVREWWWLGADGQRFGSKRKLRKLPDDTPAVSSLLEERSAFQVIGFTTPEGRIEMNLPHDLSAGDQISGTFDFLATGSEREQGRALGILRSYSLEVAGVDLRLLHDTWTTRLPAELPGIAEVTLWDITGALIGGAAVPLVEPQAASELYRIPRFTQGGDALVVRGRFDGDLANTAITIGDAAAPVLAESPRTAVALAPRRPVGPVEIRIVEAGTTAVGQLRNVDVQVSAPKSTITTGERIDLKIEVSGLEGLEQPLRIELINHTLVLAHFLEHGLQPTFEIQPADVQAGGRYTLTVSLEGSQGGTFDVEARLVPTP